MSFLFSPLEIPLWLLIFACASAAPLWIKWYRMFHKKFIVTGKLERKLRKAAAVAEEKVDVLKKATDGWNASVEHEKKSDELKKSGQKNLQAEEDQPYVKIVIKTLALNGDAGMMLQSIADKLDISSNEVKKALSYLEKNEFTELVGTKYYLAARGKKYCINRGYIKE